MSIAQLAAVAIAGAPDASDDPFTMLFSSGREFFVLVALVPVAVFVFWYGSRQFARLRGGSSLRPAGRVLPGFRRRRPEAWRATVKSLEGEPVTPIAEARSGPVRVQGRLVTASGNLGGEPGRECVWRNRAGARPESAVGAELVVLADDSGRCGLEGLEGAYVIATVDKHSFHHENVSLYLGDEVEVFASFDREVVGDDDDPSQNVYGTLTDQGGLDVRLVRRPPAKVKATADAPSQDPESARSEEDQESS